MIDPTDGDAASSNAILLANFVRYLAHDLSNPITSIRLSGEMLRGELPQQVRSELHEIILSASTQLESILERAVYFVSLEQPRQHPMRIQDLLDLSLKRYFGVIAIEIDLSVDVSDRVIHVDPELLLRLLHEVITNARDARADSLQLSGHLEGDHFVLSVLDNGEGCSSQDVNQMFEPFVSTRDGQLGIGLSIARSIAVGHGGSITMRNAVSSGSLVEIRLVVSQ
jgi:signal transduction histidine kinase